MADILLEGKTEAKLISNTRIELKVDTDEILIDTSIPKLLEEVTKVTHQYFNDFIEDDSIDQIIDILEQATGYDILEEYISRIKSLETKVEDLTEHNEQLQSDLGYLQASRY